MCDNVGDHLIGNVYARYDWEDQAQAAVDALNQKWYAGEQRVRSNLLRVPRLLTYVSHSSS